jgi:hypothetical protein
MCSAARFRRGQNRRAPSRWLAALVVAAVPAGCSVYQSDLLDGAGGGGSGSGFGGTAEPPSSSGGGGRAGGAAKAGSGFGGTVEPPSEAGGAGEEAGGAPGTAGTTGEPSGGSAGTTSGAGGSGGPVIDPVGILDGFEDDDLTLPSGTGRNGVWYLFNDGSDGTMGPAPFACSKLSDAPAALGMYAMHITATGFTGWGSGLGVDFRAGKKVYDGSKLSGVRFWARVGEGKNTRHRIQLVDTTTDALGGKCNPAANAPEGEKCDDHFGKDLVLTTTWTLYVVPFGDLTQAGFGTSAPALDKAHLYGLQVTAKPKLNVDLWIDEIEFF